MSRINTNVSSLIAQTHLGRTNADLQVALNRLSTGLKINSGKDDPAGLIASENLRRDIVSIERAISNSERANQLIATADSALGQVSNLLNDIRSLVTEAANTGALSEEQIAANQLQVDSSLEAIDRIAQVTTFQGRRIFDGSLNFITDANSTQYQDLSIQQANLGATGSIGVNITISAAATQGELSTTFNQRHTFAIGDGTNSLTFAATLADPTATDFTVTVVEGAPASGTVDASFAANTLTLTFDSTAGAITAQDVIDAITTDAGVPAGTFVNVAQTGGTGTLDATPAGTNVVLGTTSDARVLADSVTFQLAGTTGAEVFTFQAGATIQNVRDAVNLVSDATGVDASISGNSLLLTSDAYGSDAYVDVDVITEGTNGDFRSGLTDVASATAATRSTGTDISASVNGFGATGKGNTLSINTSTLDFSLTATAGSTTAISFNITDGGAIFQLGPDVVSTQQARIGLESLNTGQLGGASGRLFELKTGMAHSLSSDVAGASKIVDEVIDKVTSLRGRLGAFQRTTLESNITSLRDTLTNLTEAESSIRDADFAQETARLTRAQILVQSGTAVLTIANQNPQNVLSLLR